MNSKLRPVLLAAALAVLVAAAYFAYSALSAGASGSPELSAATPSPAPKASTLPKSSATPRQSSPPAEPSPVSSEGDDSGKAPDFTVYTESGDAVKLSDFLGQPVIINFWATWCGYCTMEMPLFQEVFDERGDEIAFLMIDCTDGRTETVEVGAQYISDEGYTFPVYYDTSLVAQSLYSIRSLPTTLFIDTEGRIVGSRIGMITEELFEKGLERLS